MKNRIGDLRSAKDLTQEDLAKEIGVSRQTINAIEKGRAMSREAALNVESQNGSSLDQKL